MRRKDREVTDINTIRTVISRCDVLRIGLSDGDFPYIVPVNFGYRFIEDKIYFYFHGASEGRKFELISKNCNCSFEMDNQLKLDILYESKDITTRYECVMGKGNISIINDSEKKLQAIRCLVDRYEEIRGFMYNEKAALAATVYEVEVRELSCKINPLN